MTRIALVGLLLAVGLVTSHLDRLVTAAIAQEATPAAECPETTAAENEAMARRWFEEALNGADLAVLDEILAEEFTYHSAALGEVTAEEAAEKVLGPILTGFPDAHYTVEEAFTGEDVVTLIWSARGTHTGEFQGYAPTGNTAKWTGINVYRFACGRIVEAWAESDALGRLRQLGVVGTPTP
jgi:steroid delta-isomerase-like uncharacterized protein